MVLLLIAAAAMASFLRTRGDRHRLGGATDLAGSLDSVKSVFNAHIDRPRLIMVLAPACPVCLEGAETVQSDLLGRFDDLEVLAIWMEALPFDITRNPARRVESFADQPRMSHFYDMQQVSAAAVDDVIDWRHPSRAWDLFLLYPAGVSWDDRLPRPRAWFHQREEANPDHYRTGSDLRRALAAAVETL